MKSYKQFIGEAKISNKLAKKGGRAIDDLIKDNKKMGYGKIDEPQYAELRDLLYKGDESKLTKFIAKMDTTPREIAMETLWDADNKFKGMFDQTYNEEFVLEAVDMNKLREVQQELISKYGKAVSMVGKAKGKNTQGDVMMDQTYATQTVFKVGKVFLAAYKPTATNKFYYSAFKNVNDLKVGKEAEFAGQSTGHKDFKVILKWLDKNAKVA